MATLNYRGEKVCTQVGTYNSSIAHFKCPLFKDVWDIAFENCSAVAIFHNMSHLSFVLIFNM